MSIAVGTMSRREMSRGLRRAVRGAGGDFKTSVRSSHDGAVCERFIITLTRQRFRLLLFGYFGVVGLWLGLGGIEFMWSDPIYRHGLPGIGVRVRWGDCGQFVQLLG